jgi:glycosyltransferase involved in cell wall biosynthesis
MIHKISFIIPVYNEVKTVKRAIQDILDLKIPNKELIIIDNGSTDGSVDIIKSYENNNDIFVYLKKYNTGYGSSIKKAFEMSSGKYAYIQYADLEYDQKSCFEMYDAAEKNNLDVIFGSRFNHNIKINLEMMSIIKAKPSYLATFICTFLINFFYKKDFKDIIGGKFYNLNSIRQISINSNGQGFDFELVSKLCKLKLKIGEVFVHYVPRKNSSEKKIKFYHMFVALYQIFRVKFLD